MTRKLVSQALQVNEKQAVPDWIEVAPAEMRARVVSLPKRENVSHPIKEQLVVEICSK